jgi:hypothetical protein
MAQRQPAEAGNGAKNPSKITPECGAIPWRSRRAPLHHSSTKRADYGVFLLLNAAGGSKWKPPVPDLPF